MGKKFPGLTATLTDFIHRQSLFFVATAPETGGHVNLSPKGMDSLRVLGPNRLVWLSVTGSGNETAAHVLQNGRMTVMWCAFEGPPRILRTYGTARVIYPDHPEWDALAAELPTLPGARQIFDQQIELVQSSCGMAVPLMDYVEDRQALNKFARRRGKRGLTEYWAEKNRVSLDGLETGL